MGTVTHHQRPLNVLNYYLLSTAVVQAIIIASLLWLYIKLRKKEQNTGEIHRHLESRLIERSEKLKKTNDQLYEEIAKHEVTEERLRETQDYLNCIISSMPSVLIGVTRNGLITHWNRSAKDYTGIDQADAVCMKLSDVVPKLGIDIKIVETAIDTNKPQRRENIKEGHASQARYHDLTIYPLISNEINGAVIRIDDITLRVRLETMMIQNEKMRSLGELSAGVAHEINNPLSTIIQGVQNIQRRTDPLMERNKKVADSLDTEMTTIASYLEKREITCFLENIRSAGQRAASIVTNMLEFSRAQDNAYEPINIVYLLEQSIHLSEQSFIVKKADVNIVSEFDKDKITVPCSAPEIQQVILNLINNAYQAFTDSNNSRHLTVTVRAYERDEHAIIEVEDNGPGMNSWVKKHIFDPFFTTKRVGQGTGLGLSVSYFIITEHHQGTIEVHSNKDEGSLFRIGLPLNINKNAF